LRRVSPALVAGTYIPIHEGAPEYLAFLRESDEQRCLVILNYSDRSQHVHLDFTKKPIELLFSSHRQSANERYVGEIHLAPYEILIADVED
jgi:glycosidase